MRRLISYRPFFQRSKYALMLVVSLLALLFPQAAMGQDTYDYDLSIGETQVTSENADNVLSDNGTPTVTYDATRNILTLNNATLGSNTGETPTMMYIESGLENLTINLVGTNRLYGNITVKTTVSSDAPAQTQTTAGTLSFTGNGTLEIECSDGVISGFSSVDFGEFNLLSNSAPGVHYLTKTEAEAENTYPALLDYANNGVAADLKLTKEAIYPIWVYIPGSEQSDGFQYKQITDANKSNVLGDDFSSVSYDGNGKLTVKGTQIADMYYDSFIIGEAISALTVHLIGYNDIGGSGKKAFYFLNNAATLSFTTSEKSPGSLNMYGYLSNLVTEINYDNNLSLNDGSVTVSQPTSSTVSPLTGRVSVINNETNGETSMYSTNSILYASHAELVYLNNSLPSYVKLSSSSNAATLYTTSLNASLISKVIFQFDWGKFTNKDVTVQIRGIRVIDGNNEFDDKTYSDAISLTTADADGVIEIPLTSRVTSENLQLYFSSSSDFSIIPLSVTYVSKEDITLTIPESTTEYSVKMGETFNLPKTTSSADGGTSAQGSLGISVTDDASGGLPLTWSVGETYQEYVEITSNESYYVVTPKKPGMVELTATFAGDDTYFSKEVTCSLTVAKGDPALEFDNQSATATIREEWTAPTLSNTSNVTVAYSSENTNVATIDSETGAVTLVGVGVTTITAYFSGNDNYNATRATYNLTVKKNLSDETITIDGIGDQTYTGEAIEPTITVKDGDQAISESAISVAYSENHTDVGTVTVTITPNTNAEVTTYYVGEITTTFKIVPATATITAADQQVTYNTESQDFSCSSDYGTTVVTYYTSEADRTADANGSTTAPTNAGTYYVRVTLEADNYTATAKDATFTISPKDISVEESNTSIGNITDQTYTGSAITPQPEVTVEFSIPESTNTTIRNVSLSNGTDLEFTYENNVNVASSTDNNPPKVIITGKGNYTGTKTKTFTIVKATAEITQGPTAKTDLTYTGEPQKLLDEANLGSSNVGSLSFSLTENGTYTTAIPEATNAGDYNVYYKVVDTDNYNGSTSATSLYVTAKIGRASGAISYETEIVNKTFVDAAFTNAITKTGDGTVSYSSSNTNVATVDATSGQVTIEGAGTATITATVTDGTNYTYAKKTASYSLSVATATMTVTAEGYSGTYDTEEHTINVTAPKYAIVTYGTTEGTYDLEAAPAYTNAGTYTVYYKVTMDNYTPVTGSETVTITPAAATVSFEAATIEKTFGDAEFTNAITNTGDGTVSYSTSSEAIAKVDATSGLVTIVGAGTATITATVSGGTNYTYASNATFVLTVAAATMEGVTAADYSGKYNGQPHTATVTAPEGATVKYGTTESTYDLDAAPSFTDVGTYTVFYQVTKANYTTVTGSYTVTISRDLGITFAETQQWATYYSTEDLAVPEGLTAYAVSAVNATSGEVTAQELSYIPKNNAVLLMRAQDTDLTGYVAAPYSDAPEEITNILQGSTEAVSVSSITSGTVYVLYNDVFKRASGGDIPARKAYLVVSDAAGARLKINAAGQSTAIEMPVAEDGEDIWYGIDGRKLEGKPQRTGIYIYNGKKVFVNKK